MSSIKVRPLRDDLPFGVRITGVDFEALKDPEVHRQINAVFEERGMIVFEEVEPSSKLQVEISKVFGPLKEHPVRSVPRAITDLAPGVIEVHNDPNTHAIVEIDGKRLMMWIPWHFDHCYNNELNRAGVLRITIIPPEGGMTGFTDGVELYKMLSPELRRRIEDKKVLYTMDLLYENMRFGVPRNFRTIQSNPRDILDQAKETPRAIHPAVWTRRNGEKVLHVSPWMAVGLQGHENADGDALLEAVSQEINAKARQCSYFHKWNPTDMVIWDNWRMLHAVSGHDPQYPRCMHRTTIRGDYGLGAFENNVQGRYAALERTV